MAGLSLKSVRKVYPNGFVAVHGIDLEVIDGEFVVLVGPSGCGKSTLLRLVAGLERITDGEVRIGEHRVNEREPADRDIAMVFQNYALYPHMSVYDNMAYGLRNRGTPKAEIERRVREAAGVLGLAELLKRKPRLLSGGQRQRVAMGRAIVREPQVFLFDEPLSNLDAKLRVQMRVEVKRLQRELGVTSIYVTHDQVEAMTMADRLVVLNAGRAEQIGTPLELYNDPATEFVASFIGSPAMNLLDTQRRGDGSLALGSWALPVRDASADHVRLGVRPEHLRIDDAGPMEVKVDLAEALGAETLIYGTLIGTDDGAQTIVVRLAGAHPDITDGQHLRCSAEAEHLHLFDKASGQRL